MAKGKVFLYDIWRDINAPKPLGVLINQNFGGISNLSNYTINNPGSIWAISGGNLNTSKATPGGYLDYAYYTPYGATVLDRWIQDVTFKATAINANSWGMAFGCLNTNVFGSDQILGFAECDTGSTGRIYLFRNGSTIASNLSGFAISAGDTLRFTFERSYLNYKCTFTNMTTSAAQVLSYNCSLASTANTNQTIGKWALFNIGGTYDVSGFSVTSNALKGPGYCFVGDSITEGYCGGSLNAAWPAQAMSFYPNRTYTKAASQAVYTQGILDAINEIKSIKPAKYVVMLGGNDVAFGVASGTYQANYTNIVNQMKSIGAKVIHCLATPRNAFNMTALNSWISSTFTSDVIVDTFTPIKGSGTSLSATYDIGDGTHPNAGGMAVTGTTVAAFL